jgi:hypothetical protein
LPGSAGRSGPRRPGNESADKMSPVRTKLSDGMSDLGIREVLTG